jgi:hypothetical protein
MSKDKAARMGIDTNSPECNETRRKPGRPPKPKPLMGRPPKLVNQIERAMKALDANLPMLIDKLIELAYTKNDPQIIQYLIDRKMGRPRQEVASTVKGALIVVSPDDYATAINTARLAEQALLTMPTLHDE